MVAVPPRDSVAISVPFRLEDQPPAQRQRPAAPPEPLPEPVSYRDFGDVTTYRPGGAEAKRHPDIATEPSPLVRVPCAAPIDKRRHPETHEAGELVAHEHPIFQREPRHARARELVDAEDARPFLQYPEVELRPRFRPAERAAFEVD